MKLSEKYFYGVHEVLNDINNTQSENIQKGAEIIADCIERDGIIHAFGTGHANLIANDISMRANSLIPVNHIADISLSGTVNSWRSVYMERVEGVGKVVFDSVMPHPEDIFLVISNSGRNGVPIEFAKQAKLNGFPVIAETSVKYSMSQPSRHSSGKRLLDFADVVLDNCVPAGDMVVKVEGRKYLGLGPTSGLAGIYIVHATLIQAITIIEERGMEAPVSISGNMDGSEKHNNKFLSKYWDRLRNY